MLMIFTSRQTSQAISAKATRSLMHRQQLDHSCTDVSAFSTVHGNIVELQLPMLQTAFKAQVFTQSNSPNVQDALHAYVIDT